MLHPASKGLKSHTALVCAVILISIFKCVRTYNHQQSYYIKLHIIHGILLDKLVEETAESRKEETFAMPQHRKYNDRYNKVRLLSTTLSGSVN